MNLLTVLLVYVLNMRAEGDIQKVFLLENNFWCADQEQTDDGFLSRVGVRLEYKNEVTEYSDYYPQTCHSLKSTNLKYFVLKDPENEISINNFLVSEDKNFVLRFLYLFTENPIEIPADIENYKGKKQFVQTYKFLEKVPENKNSINLRFETPDFYINLVKTSIASIISMDLSRFKQNIVILNEVEEKLREMEEVPGKFKLFHFKNNSECFSSLKNFISKLNCLKLLKDDELLSCESTGVCFDETSTIKTSEFKNCLWGKFNENLKNIYKIELNQTWGEIFVKCYDYLENKFLNSVSYPIAGKYDINFYIEQISNFIYEVGKQLQENNEMTRDFKFNEMTRDFQFRLKCLQVEVVGDLCGSAYLKNFSELIGKEVEILNDYININRRLVDYHNVFEQMLSLYHSFCLEFHAPVPFFTPVFIDNYFVRITDGIKINLSKEIKNIKGFDKQGEEVLMVEDTDYFIQNGNLYCPSEVLKMKNIQEIEINSFDDENNKRFKVNEYLNYCESNL